MGLKSLDDINCRYETGQFISSKEGEPTTCGFSFFIFQKANNQLFEYYLPFKCEPKYRSKSLMNSIYYQHAVSKICNILNINDIRIAHLLNNVNKSHMHHIYKCLYFMYNYNI